MKVRNLKHAKELSLIKWEFLKKYDFVNRYVAIELLDRHEKLRGLFARCGFCQYYYERSNRYKREYFPCPLDKEKKCNSDSECCNGLCTVWYANPTAKNARKVYEYIKKVEV